MIISKNMEHNVVSIPVAATIRESAALIVKKHIGLLPVVDKDNKLVGVVGLSDLLTLELPDFVSFIEDLDFVHDFGAVEDTHPPARTLDKQIKSIMKEPITVEADCGLLRAYALMWVQPEVESVLKRIEWSVLVFFGALFVMAGGLEHAGVMESIVGVARGVSNIPPVWFGLAIIWIVALLPRWWITSRSRSR